MNSEIIKIDPSTPIPTWGFPLSKRDLDEHWLYRLFDAGNNLLYVGITSDLHFRWSTHRRVKPWFRPTVRGCSIETFEDKKSAHAAEQQAIRQEIPLHNVVGVDELNPEQRRGLDDLVEVEEEIRSLEIQLQELKDERAGKTKTAHRMGISNYRMAQVTGRSQPTIAGWLK